jgi:hypothetical protein
LILKISKTVLYITVDADDKNDENIIDICFDCPLTNAEIMNLWKLWEKCCQAVEDIQQLWPEIYSSAYVVCSHCLMNNSAAVKYIPIDNVKSSSVNFVECFGDDIPSTLVYPPGKPFS